MYSKSSRGKDRGVREVKRRAMEDWWHPYVQEDQCVRCKWHYLTPSLSQAKNKNKGWCIWRWLATVRVKKKKKKDGLWVRGWTLELWEGWRGGAGPSVTASTTHLFPCTVWSLGVPWGREGGVHQSSPVSLAHQSCRKVQETLITMPLVRQSSTPWQNSRWHYNSGSWSLLFKQYDNTHNI